MDKMHIIPHLRWGKRACTVRIANLHLERFWWYHVEESKSVEICFRNLPRIWYVDMFARPPQPSGANLKVSSSKQRETVAALHAFLAAAMTSGWPDNCIQDLRRPCFFFLRSGPRGYHYRVLQVQSHHRKRRLALSLRVVKHLNKLPASVVAASPVNILRKKLRSSTISPYHVVWDWALFFL